jgi:hypothetical protein
MITPRVPKSMVPIALGPREAIAFILHDKSNKIRAGGRRYFDVQPYRAESSGVIPMVVLNIGKKYIHITGGKYLNSFLKTVFDFK